MVLPFMKVAVSQLFSKPSCEMYPFVPKEAAPHYRGRIAYDADKCIGCGLCTRVCDGEAITIVKEPVEGGENITLTFNLGTCTFCANCADFCPKGCIELTGDYHMVATKEEDLLVSGTHFQEKKKPAPKPAPAPKAAPETEKKAVEPAAKAVEPRGDGKPVADMSKCIFCTLCAKKCPQEAIEVNRAEKTWKLNEDDCIACGNCETVCPKKAIVI